MNENMNNYITKARFWRHKTTGEYLIVNSTRTHTKTKDTYSHTTDIGKATHLNYLLSTMGITKELYIPVDARVTTIIEINANSKMQTEYCSSCGASIRQYKHGLTDKLARALLKLYHHGTSVFNIVDIGLTQTERLNFQKLRYFGLVERVGEKTGWYRITLEGKFFCEGGAKSPKSVTTYRGKVESQSDRRVSIYDLLNDPKPWSDREQYLKDSKFSIQELDLINR